MEFALPRQSQALLRPAGAPVHALMNPVRFGNLTAQRETNSEPSAASKRHEKIRSVHNSHLHLDKDFNGLGGRASLSRHLRVSSGIQRVVHQID
jgi:hypothetical protein